jgi:WD40 repeat protein
MLVPVTEVDGHKGKGWSVSWGPKGDKLVSVGEDKTAQIWLLDESKVRGDGVGVRDGSSILSPGAKFGAESHSRSVRDVSWSPCGKYVVLGSFDSQVTLWEVTNGGRDAKLLSVVEGHENEVKSVAWAPSGNFFSSCGRDKNVMIW